MIGKADVRDFEDCLIMSVLTLKLTYLPTLYNPTCQKMSNELK
jgi:hypothetical protein